MKVSFEPAATADAQALVDIQIRAFHHDSVLYPGVEIGGPPGYDSVEQMVENVQKFHVHKILYDGRLVGGLIVFDRGAGHFHLDGIFIDPPLHNRGIGTQAMRFIEQTFPAARWTLDTPEWAVRNRHFYEKLGYIQVGRKVEEGTGLILISYEKRLVGVM